MGIENIVLLFLGGGFFLGLFISILLLTDKQPGSRGNPYLAMVVFLCSLNLIHPHFGLIFGLLPEWFDLELSEPIQFLMAPLVWLYIRNQMRGDFSFKLHDLVHFLPFAVVMVFLALPWSVELEQLSPYPLSSIILWTLLVVQSMVYLIISGKLVIRIKEEMYQRISSLNEKDLKWIRSIFHLFALLNIGNVGLLFVIIHFQAFVFVKVFLALLFMILIWALGFQALRRKLSLPKISNPQRDYSPLEENLALDLQEKLKRIMEERQLYLNPELNLDDLTTALSCSRNELSWVLNNRMGQNFYHFVNTYRVQEVIRLMEDPQRDHQKILALAFDSGFNSKPAFNTVFKKTTGKTPSEFRKEKRGLGPPR